MPAYDFRTFADARAVRPYIEGYIDSWKEREITSS